MFEKSVADDPSDREDISDELAEFEHLEEECISPTKASDNNLTKRMNLYQTGQMPTNNSVNVSDSQIRNSNSYSRSSEKKSLASRF